MSRIVFPGDRLRPIRAFTLLELIVVVAIIGIIATIAAVNATGVLGDAKRKAALASMRQILAAAETVYLLNGSYPETMDGLLEARGADGQKIGLKEPTQDPWDNDFEYVLVDGTPCVRCFGSDKAEGGEGAAADLVLPKERSGE